MFKTNKIHIICMVLLILNTLNEIGPIVISHGKGIYVYDIHNKKYLDANSGLWNSCAGFDHPGISRSCSKTIF